MNKIILTIATILAVSFVNAQGAKTDGKDGIKFGVKGGINLTKLTGDFDPSIKVGFHLGGFMEYKLSEKFALQPELLYSTQGANYNDDQVEEGFTKSGEISIKLSYLNIPLITKYYVSNRFSCEAGPQIGILLSAKEQYDLTGTILGVPVYESGEVDIKDDLNSIDFGIIFGAGYDFNNKISIGLRYNFGLSDISEGYFFDNNLVFQLSLGYKF